MLAKNLNKIYGGFREMNVPVKVFFTEELKAICKEKGVDLWVR